MYYSQLLLYRTGVGGLRFRVRYIRNPVYPNTRLCTKHTVKLFLRAGLWNSRSVRYVREFRYNNRESGIRLIDCILQNIWKNLPPTDLLNQSGGDESGVGLSQIVGQHFARPIIGIWFDSRNRVSTNRGCCFCVIAAFLWSLGLK